MKVFLQFEKKPLLFQDPKHIISCCDPSLIRACFQDMESALSDGFYLAGFLSYEAGYSFEEKLRDNKIRDFPLIHMGVYVAPHNKNFPFKERSVNNRLEGLRLNITPDDYAGKIQTIRDHIAKGDVYQITYCIKLLFRFQGDPFSLYSALLEEQPVPYPAYIETGLFHILSLSPEMFLKKNSGRIASKPMKGTWRRGRGPLEDFVERFRFQVDPKNRAENVMNADLLRNDLGRIGENIRAPRLFEVARYRTLFQMTSTVTGRVEKGIPLYEIFASVFPSGSVTGTPKIRAMEIIKQLEAEERHIYTGAIGYIAPSRDLFFNIPIRTLLIRGKDGEMGIGGGIVWDSTAEGEWSEGLLKARFVTTLADRLGPE